jgi:hypothetical protein
MYRAASLCALLCLATLTFAQTPSTTLQLVYVIDGSTLTTYNVHPQTLQATEAGRTTLQQATYPYLATSPNGHTIYYTAFQNTNQQGERLYVYNTNGSGVPDSRPVQSLSLTRVWSILVDPTGKFLYLVHEGTPGSQYTRYTIVRYVINPTTGRISQPVAEATYTLDSVISGLYCSLGIFGMNAAGSKLYDEIDCSYPHGGNEVTYNERTVNTQTGVLGPDQKVYYWNNSSGGGEKVQFVKNLMFDFVVPNNYQQNINEVNVYPLRPNVSNPLIKCDASILANCGSDYGLSAHPSAQYVFLYNSQSSGTEIDKVDLSSKQIVATSSTIPYEVQQFSPHGSIAYAANDVGTALNIEIYGFNVANGNVTAGGLISVPSDLDSWFTAERH